MNFATYALHVRALCQHDRRLVVARAEQDKKGGPTGDWNGAGGGCGGAEGGWNASAKRPQILEEVGGDPE